MRLVVIDAKKRSYRIFEGRSLVAEYVIESGPLATAEQIEEIRVAPATPQGAKP